MTTAKERYYAGCIGSDDCTADDYVKELEQQVEELKKAKEVCGIIFESHNVVLNNSNSGYEKLVDIKIGSHKH